MSSHLSIISGRNLMKRQMEKLKVISNKSELIENEYSSMSISTRKSDIPVWIMRVSNWFSLSSWNNIRAGMIFYWNLSKCDRITWRTRAFSFYCCNRVWKSFYSFHFWKKNISSKDAVKAQEVEKKWIKHTLFTMNMSIFIQNIIILSPKSFWLISE